MARLVPGLPFSLQMHTPFNFAGVWEPALARFALNILIITVSMNVADNATGLVAVFMLLTVGRKWLRADHAVTATDVN